MEDMSFASDDRVMSAEIKVCLSCDEEKPVDDFYPQRSRDGAKIYLRSYCKECDHARVRNWRQNNKERLAAENKYWRQNNKERVAATHKNWRQNNRDKRAALQSSRRALKNSAQPKWLTVEQNEAITSFYWLAKDVSSVSDSDYHVDHIVPLKNEHVCGLHVPWNLQILPADLNIAKSNKFDCWWLD